MEVGIELDTLVATKVMGWESIAIGYFNSDEETSRQNELEDWINNVGIDSIGDYYIFVPDSFWVEKDDWSPSTDILAAWQVVEKMRDIGEGCQVNILTGIFKKYRVTVREFKMNCTVVDIVDNTAPEAICKAALIAKLEEENVETK